MFKAAYTFNCAKKFREDKILINNIILISKSINNLLPPIFKNWFIFRSEIHNYDTVSSSADKLFKPLYITDSYGKKIVIIGAINSYIFLPTEKFLTFHNVIILIKSVVNTDKNNYYYNIFLAKGSCKDKSNIKYF